MRKLTLLGLLLLIFAFTACSNQEKEEGREPEPESESEPAEEIEQDETVNQYPFTGEETEKEKEINNKAVAVMVSNVDAARPQTGLSQADVVFEMLAEGNITRFMAIYQSEEPDLVGPIRSAREYFFTLADNYDALYVYSGAANFINDMIASRDIEHIEGGLYDNDKHLTVRETFRKAPHNMYLQFGAVEEVAEEKGYEMEANYEPLPFVQDEQLPEDLPYEAGTYAKIDYNGVEPIVKYEYDETAENYIRYSDGEQTAELESEIPIEIDNVFIVEADHEVIDEEGRRKVDIESGGDAVLLHRGKSLELQWENREGRIIPVLDGEEVSFIPGKTWINFVDSNPMTNVENQIEIGES